MSGQRADSTAPLSPVRVMIKGCLRGCIDAAETAGDGRDPALAGMDRGTGIVVANAETTDRGRPLPRPPW